MSGPDPWTPVDLEEARWRALYPVETVYEQPLMTIKGDTTTWASSEWIPGGEPAPWPWLDGGTR